MIISVIDSIKHMYQYHKGVTSPLFVTWYEWPLNIAPYSYYQGQLLPEGRSEAITALGIRFVLDRVYSILCYYCPYYKKQV